MKATDVEGGGMTLFADVFDGDEGSEKVPGTFSFLTRYRHFRLVAISWLVVESFPCNRCGT